MVEKLLYTAAVINSLVLLFKVKYNFSVLAITLSLDKLITIQQYLLTTPLGYLITKLTRLVFILKNY